MGLELAGVGVPNSSPFHPPTDEGMGPLTSALSFLSYILGYLTPV